MNKNECWAKVRDLLGSFAGRWRATTSPEPPGIYNLHDTPPVKVRRDSYRVGFADGVRALLNDFDKRNVLLDLLAIFERVELVDRVGRFDARLVRADAQIELLKQIVDHWFVQGGTMQFGELSSTPQNADELVSLILERVRVTRTLYVDAHDAIEETHRVLNDAWIAHADGTNCDDHDCHSKIAHRVRCLVNARNAAQRVADTALARFAELAETIGIAESSGGRMHAWVTRPYLDVTIERLAQDTQWGGPAIDDTRGFLDWIRFIRHQIDRAVAHDARPVSARERLVKIAALAIAAIEALDRANAERARKASPHA